MRLTPQTLSAAGDSPWMVPGPMLLSNAVSLALTYSVNANLTAQVQYTYDSPAQTPQAVTYAWAANVLTVTLANHGLNVGDTADLTSVSGNFTGNYDVASVPTVNTFTCAAVGAFVANDTGTARTYKLFTHATVTGTGAPPAKIDGLLGALAAAFRLHVTGYTAGSATLSAQQVAGY